MIINSLNYHTRIAMTFFTFTCNFVGLVSNICVLFLTVYTLYLTAFSRKMDFISMGHSMSVFFGESIHFYIKNRSLHSIPITKVFLLKNMGGMFHRINIADYEQPLIIDAWHIGKIETESFTHIMGFDEPEEGVEKASEDVYEKPSISTIHINAVIGVETGNKVIWIKPYKKAPLRMAKRAYKKLNFDILPVSRKCCGDKILSKSVNYVIYLLSRDLNGQKAVKTVFAIVDEQHILLSDPICGHNGLEGQFGSSAMELEKFLCDSLGIDKRNIRVEQIEQFL